MFFPKNDDFALLIAFGIIAVFILAFLFKLICMFVTYRQRINNNSTYAGWDAKIRVVSSTAATAPTTTTMESGGMMVVDPTIARLDAQGISLSGRSFLKLLDFTPAEIRYLLDMAAALKRLKLTNTPHKYLPGKNVVLLFEKTSTRTRCAFEVGACDLGMGVTYLDPGSSQVGKKESIPDSARVLGRIFDGIEYRGYGQTIVEDLSKFSGVPVWNGLTNEFHPTQILADFLTIEEKLGRLQGVNFTFMGDARYNMGNSLMIGCAMMGVNFTACAPKELWPSEDLVAKARALAEVSGAHITLTDDVAEGTRNADILYTDIWVSMGEPESSWEARIALLKKYQVNRAAMANAKPTALFMHCLPAFHDTNTTIGAEIAKKFGLTALEVTDEVFESKQSIVFDEAANRMHTIKAVMYATLK